MLDNLTFICSFRYHPYSYHCKDVDGERDVLKNSGFSDLGMCLYGEFRSIDDSQIPWLAHTVIRYNLFVFL